MGEPDFGLAGVVPLAWRQRHVLARGRCDLQGALVDLGKIPVRRVLERRHAKLLASFGIKHLDVSDITSKVRPITQAIAKSLFDDGLEGLDGPVAGIVYRSNLDQETCFALFGGRYEIQRLGAPRPLSQPIEELQQICQELGLVLGGT